MNQLQGRGLVDCVGVGPVDTDLKSFLVGGIEKDSWIEQSNGRMWGDWKKRKQSEIKSLAVNSDHIF